METKRKMEVVLYGPRVSAEFSSGEMVNSTLPMSLT
jgi:hypothetical protein